MRNFISNFKFSKNIKSNFLIKISISKSFYISICAQSPFTTLDKILAPTIRRKINATLLTIPSFFVLIPIQKKKERNVLFHFSSVTRFTPVPRSKSQYFFEGGKEKATTFRKGAFSREESCYPRVITPLGGTTRSRHMRAKLVPVPLSLVVSPWFMYLCISTQPLLLD